MKLRNLLISIGVCLVAGIIGSLATFPSIPTWYATLVKPSFSPPNWLFGPVWTTLYVLMGIAMYLVWQKKGELKIFMLHLAVNAGWSIVFFGFRSISGGMVMIIVLWVLIVAIIKMFYRVDKTAAYLLIPYLAWVSFASFLNFSLLMLN